MKTFARSLIALSLMTLASAAHAAGDQGQENPTTTLTFEQFREACLTPAKFHNQAAPKNIQVTCQDVQAKWVPDVEGKANMDTHRVVRTAISSDKYNAAAVTTAVNSVAQTFACPQLKQVTESIETIRAVSCADLIAFSGNSTDFCVNVVNSMRASNPQAIKTLATGAKMSFCSGISGQDQQNSN